MDEVRYFSLRQITCTIPTLMRDPFANEPHDLAIRAARGLQRRLDTMPEVMQALHKPDGGKMFGVLVVANDEGRVGYLSAFSGMLNQDWVVSGFVPPVFDAEARSDFLPQGEAFLKKQSIEITRCLENAKYQQARQNLDVLEVQCAEDIEECRREYRLHKAERAIERDSLLNEKDDLKRADRLRELSTESQRDKQVIKHARHDGEDRLAQARAHFLSIYENPIIAMRKKRRSLSRKLHKRVFDTYQLHSAGTKTVLLRELFGDMMPPGGAGDCAAPKLIQFANKHHLRMLALTEFWWGASPAQGIRHHGNFYPPCRGKCHPILPAMLAGVALESVRSQCGDISVDPDVVYEDECLIVVNKPAGFLSVPGKNDWDSVHDWLQRRYTDISPMLVHRLDMATSGLLMAAKTARMHKLLQQQFIRRQVKKRYVAVLSKEISTGNTCVELPLRVDLDDRPRQLVCYEYGKSAKTLVEPIESDGGRTRVYFYPVTGRTHQLRVHAAHKDGLNAAIIGDALYGESEDRLMLHAEKLNFEHPETGEQMELISPAPF